ncbi:MAG TPA: LuxR C-terminal-related transcriptional regulator, partial [Actinomycetota bacterium]|nr:LuxR C-terminal-related transcriptional regulator [Actinomycetota bacterium]
MERPGPVALEHAKAMEVAGVARYLTRDRDGGRALVEEAAGRFDAISAPLRAEHARLWLSENQVRRRGRKRSTLPAGLTQREIEILAMVVRGRSNQEIADALTLSFATVKTHVERILAKTGAGRRSELAVIAMRLGVLPGSAPPESPGSDP